MTAIYPQNFFHLPKFHIHCPVSPAPGDCHSVTFCFYEFDYSRYLIKVESYSICPFVIVLFHLTNNVFKIRLCCSICQNFPPFLKNKFIWGVPGGAVVENPPANLGDTGSSPGLGRSHMPRSNWAREPQLRACAPQQERPR